MIEVVRENPGRLIRQVWRFGAYTPTHYNNEVIVRLVNYDHQTRPTTRHKYQTLDGGRYDSHDRRGMDPASVPMPQDVIEEAKAAVTITVKV